MLGVSPAARVKQQRLCLPKTPIVSDRAIPLWKWPVSGYLERGRTSVPWWWSASTRACRIPQLVELAGNYNKEGRVPKDAPKNVEVLDVLNQTASAKLTASWGIDYMHLAKYDGKWKIVHVLWQTAPEKTE